MIEVHKFVAECVVYGEVVAFGITVLILLICGVGYWWNVKYNKRALGDGYGMMPEV